MKFFDAVPFRCVGMSKMQGAEDEDDRNLLTNDLVRLPMATRQIGHHDTRRSFSSSPLRATVLQQSLGIR